MRSLWIFGLGAGVALLSSTSEGAAQEATAPPLQPGAPRAAVPDLPPPPPSDELAWRDEWGHARADEYVLMFAAGGLALASSFIPPADASWSGNDFDDSVRDGMRLKSSEARKTVRGAGDVFFYGLMAYPVVVDSLIVALPRDSEVAWQMIVMNGESLALSALASVAMARTTGRERPYLRECRRGTPDTEWDCGSNPEEDAKSFPSGHALMAFTGAGLICTHHAYLPLYGGGIPDGIACGVALAGATFNGASRVMADRHYFTDVLVGSALGLTSGIALPIALHYGKDATGTTETAIVPYASGSQIGVMGQF